MAELGYDPGPALVMLKQLQYTFAPSKWLRTWDPKEKHTLLCFRIAETIDGATAQGMQVKDARLIVTKGGGVGLSLSEPDANNRETLAAIKLSDIPLFVAAHRLLQKEQAMRDTIAVDDAVEKAADELADEVLRQIYGSEYLRRLGQTMRTHDETEPSYVGRSVLALVLSVVFFLVMSVIGFNIGRLIGRELFFLEIVIPGAAAYLSPAFAIYLVGERYNRKIVGIGFLCFVIVLALVYLALVLPSAVVTGFDKIVGLLSLAAVIVGAFLSYRQVI